jgi:hypothetical protein
MGITTNFNRTQKNSQLSPIFIYESNSIHPTSTYMSLLNLHNPTLTSHVHLSCTTSAQDALTATTSNLDPTCNNNQVFVDRRSIANMLHEKYLNKNKFIRACCHFTLATRGNNRLKPPYSQNYA